MVQRLNSNMATKFTNELPNTQHFLSYFLWSHFYFFESTILYCNEMHLGRHVILGEFPFSQSRPVLQGRVTKKARSSLKASIANFQTLLHWSVHKRRWNFLHCLLLPTPAKRKEERNPMVAISVPSHAPVLLIWKGMCLFIQMRSRSAVNSVNTPAHRMLASISTC